MTIVQLIEDENGELILPLSDEICQAVGFKIGDTVVWKDNEDGTWSITKKEVQETELVLVECVSTFRMRYVVEVPKGKSEYALDAVTCNEAVEFGQRHLNETIVGHRIVQKTDLIELALEDNEFANHQMVERVINKIK